MSRTYIAFIECVFDDTKTTKWHSESGFPGNQPHSVREIKRVRKNNARMSLVDIKNDRRSFWFKQDAVVHVINNVVIFDSD